MRHDRKLSLFLSPPTHTARESLLAGYKEPTHYSYSKRVGREVPGVVAVLLSSKCGRLGGDVLKRLVVYVATYAKTDTSQKETLPSAR